MYVDEHVRSILLVANLDLHLYNYDAAINFAGYQEKAFRVSFFPFSLRAVSLKGKSTFRDTGPNASLSVYYRITSRG